MTSPLVSIILPVYNCETYLEKALQSLFAQTYTYFELIVVNDGSTDASEKIILEFVGDSRLKYAPNERNLGLIASLNRGIELAGGKYIARMDGDDICETSRLAKQVAFLESNPEIAVIASRIRLIDGLDRDIGVWKQEYDRVTVEAIRSYLTRNNCIAHPSVMMRAEILKQYRYNPDQPLSEDYDLWLRLQADGKKIAKLKSVELSHRILPASFTRTRKHNSFARMAIVKGKFVRSQFRAGKFNGFILRTAFTALTYSVAGLLKNLKNRVSS